MVAQMACMCTVRIIGHAFGIPSLAAFDDDVDSSATEEDGTPPESRDSLAALRQRKAQLLRKIEEMCLPPSPLDALLNALGGKEAVAEMTGRPFQILRGSDGKFHVKKRAHGATANLNEKDHFMGGRKRVAIIRCALDSLQQ